MGPPYGRSRQESDVLRHDKGVYDDIYVYMYVYKLWI